MSNWGQDGPMVRRPNRWRVSVPAAAASLSCGVHAENFQTDKGIDVRWSLGGSWRARDADPLV